MTTELQPQYDSRQSFYGKARVEEEQGRPTDFFTRLIKLYSYETYVASIACIGNDYQNATVFNTYSATTLRHIKEFLKQHGFKAESKAQIEADYMKGDN